MHGTLTAASFVTRLELVHLVGRPMDRFEWLKCQPWLLPAPVSESSGDATAIDWFFNGFASFCACSLPCQPDGVLSENAAHLFFSAETPSGSLDPAQLTLKLGSTRKGPQCHQRDLIFAFENAESFYLLDFEQVASISKWMREQGCKICNKSCSASAVVRMDSSCACQHVPTFVTIRLKHVSLIVYTKDRSNSQILGAMDVLVNAFAEEKQSYIQEKEELMLCTPELPRNLPTLLGSSTKALQKFLTRLDCMSEAAVAAVDASRSNVSHMARILHVLQEKEVHFSNMLSSKQQEAKMSSFAALKHLVDQEKSLQEAILWMELINAPTTL